MPSDDLGLVRAATYSRVSTQQQAEEGFNLAEYVRLTGEYVRGRNWLLAAEYVDAGVSGRRNDRVQWQQLLAACRRGDVDKVVVHALSRFSRSAGDAITRINELRDLGIDFISLKESFDSATPNGRAMLGMTAVFAQLEAEQTAERSTLAQRAKARQGLWPGGPAPYGWRLEGEGRDAHPVPDRPEREAIAAAVRHILADNGTTGSAAALLNSLGHTGRHGGAWTHQRVLRTLSAPSLTGQVAWAKPTRPYGHHTRLDPRTGEPVWGPTVDFAVPDPPLDSDTFDRLQQALSRRRYGFKRPARPYPLSGMLCPGGQDHTMGGVASRDRRSYRCKHARWSADPDQQRCLMPRVDAEWAEQAVAERVWALADPTEVMAAAHRHIRSLADVSDVAEAARELAAAEDALRKGRKGLRTTLAVTIRAWDPRGGGRGRRRGRAGRTRPYRTQGPAAPGSDRSRPTRPRMGPADGPRRYPPRPQAERTRCRPRRLRLGHLGPRRPSPRPRMRQPASPGGHRHRHSRCAPGSSRRPRRRGPADRRPAGRAEHRPRGRLQHRACQLRP